MDLTAVEKWEVSFQGVSFVCFRNCHGEIFHFRREILKRGLPRAPFNTIEEFTRPVGMLTCTCAARLAGVETTTLKKWVERKTLKATKKVWKHGRQRRQGLLIDIFDLQECLAKRQITKYAGRRIEWDTSAVGILSRSEEN